MHLHKFYALHKKLTRVMLPVVFEEFEVPFFFTQSLSNGKRSSPLPHFMGLRWSRKRQLAKYLTYYFTLWVNQ